jgi:hypothetical protein
LDVSTEVWFLATTLITMTVVMVAYWLGRLYIIALVPACLVLSNFVGPKIVSVFGFPITAGTPLFAALPLATDLIVEKYGKKDARIAVLTAFLAMGLFVLVSRPITQMPWLPFAQTSGEAVDILFSSSVRLMLASPIAYVIWQYADIWIYGKVKEITGDSNLWIRNNISTVIAQAGSTFTFFGLAFVGTGTPWVEISFVTICFYWVIAAIDTVFVYAAKRIEPRDS